MYVLINKRDVLQSQFRSDEFSVVELEFHARIQYDIQVLCAHGVTAVDGVYDDYIIYDITETPTFRHVIHNTYNFDKETHTFRKSVILSCPGRTENVNVSGVPCKKYPTDKQYCIEKMSTCSNYSDIIKTHIPNQKIRTRTPQSSQSDMDEYIVSDMDEQDKPIPIVHQKSDGS